MESVNKNFEHNPPTYSDGSLFLGYNTPAAQTFTSYTPSSDIEASIKSITGFHGWEKRQHLQGEKGTKIAKCIHTKKISNKISDLSSHDDRDCKMNYESKGKSFFLEQPSSQTPPQKTLKPVPHSVSKFKK